MDGVTDRELWNNAMAKCKLLCDTITPLETCYSAIFKRSDDNSIYLLYLDLNTHKVVEKKLDCTFIDRITETSNNGTTAHITAGRLIKVRVGQYTDGQTVYSIISPTGDTLISLDEKYTKIWSFDNNFFLGYSPGKWGISPSYMGLFQLDKCIDRANGVTFPKFGKIEDIQIIVVYHRVHTPGKANSLVTVYYIKGNKVISHTDEIYAVSATDKKLYFESVSTGSVKLYYKELSDILDHPDCQSTFDRSTLTILQDS